MIPHASSLVFLQYLTTVFDNIQDAIVLIGVEPHDRFRLLLANDGFVRGTGHSKNNVGKDIKDVVSSESYQQLLPLYKKVIVTKHTQEFSGWFDVPLGRQAYEYKLIPILNSMGECVQIAAITRNVTDLWNIREELADKTKAVNRLNRLVAKLRTSTASSS